MDKLTLNAYAKINLFLEVTDKREDGYHEIESVMQTVSLCDAVTVTLLDEERIEVHTSDPRIPSGKDNIAYRAAAAFFAHTGLTRGADIFIEKRIPSEAGLAGGSTDGAAVLTALDILCKTALGTETLCRIGARVGADVPFCIRGGTQLARGIGDVLSPVPAVGTAHLVIAIDSGEKVSTPEAYRRIDALGKRELRRADDMIRLLASDGIASAAGELYNIFEATTQKHARVKTLLTDAGALGALMSGSGPSVFGVFATREDALRAAETVRAHGCFAAYAQTVGAEL